MTLSSRGSGERRPGLDRQPLARRALAQAIKAHNRGFSSAEVERIAGPWLNIKDIQARYSWYGKSE